MSYAAEHKDTPLGPCLAITDGNKSYETYKLQNGLVGRLSSSNLTNVVNINKTNVGPDDYNAFKDITDVFSQGATPNRSQDFAEYLVNGLDRDLFSYHVKINDHTEFGESMHHYYRLQSSVFEGISRLTICGLSFLMFCKNATEGTDAINFMQGMGWGYMGVMALFVNPKRLISKQIVGQTSFFDDLITKYHQKSLVEGKLEQQTAGKILRLNEIEAQDQKQIQKGVIASAVKVRSKSKKYRERLERQIASNFELMDVFTSNLKDFKGLAVGKTVDNYQEGYDLLAQAIGSVPQSTNYPLPHLATLPKTTLPKPSKVSIPTVEEMKKGAKPTTIKQGWLS